MFRKKIEVKSSTLLKTTEKKKFRTLIASTFFESVAKSEGDEDDGMPSDFRSSLVKGELALTKAATENGKQFEFYALDKTPVFFLEDDHLYPTVYLLWTLPTLLPRVYTHAEVFEKLKAGADLMLPGVITSRNSNALFDFPVDAVCSVCVIGNDAAMAVGLTLMSGKEMVDCEVKQGKAVRILHTYQDSLWHLGPKTRAPVIALPSRADQESQVQESDAISTGVENSLAINEVGHADIEEKDEEPATEVDVDTHFLLYFLYALQKRLRRDDELPVLASTFYGTVLLPLMPEGNKVTVQKTSFKKFSTFLHRLQEEGLVAIDEAKKGVENIARINWSHDLFHRYRDQLKSLPTTDQDQPEASASTVNERPINFRELRAITAPLLPLFHEVNKSLKKGQALSAADVRSVITAYVKSKELSNGRMIKLDQLLLNSAAVSGVQRALGDSITWEALMDSIFNKMTPCVEIEYADQSSSRKEVRKGKPPALRMKVAKRSGNKKVTMIGNVQEFGIDPKTFAQELQIALAVSATLNDSPNSIGPEVQVQGDQTTALQKILTEKYGINKKYLQVG